jgi:hypothetical protein
MTPPKPRKPIAPHMMRKIVSLRLPVWLCEFLSSRAESSGKTVESALIRAHKLKPPKGE